jgi:hypothetical protein
MRIRILIGLSLLALLAFYACGGSAELEMKRAQKAMEDARSLHAENLAPTNFEQAQKAWDHAQAAAKEGKTDTAKVLFASAKIYFGKAADVAKAKKEVLTRELDSMQIMINRNLDQVKGDLSKKNISSRQHGQVKALASEVEKENASIQKLVDQHDLVKAVETAKEVQTKIYHAQLILSGQTPPRE